MSTKVEATIDDLYHVPENGKAEIVHGKILLISPVGYMPSYAAGEVFVSLRGCTLRNKAGRAVSGSAAFIVNLPNRKSFSPDVAFYIGPDPGMKFFDGAPVFAVEVRSEGDYGQKAERQMAKKRADYFAAGTKVMWDVDLLSDDVIRMYRADDPNDPKIFRRGEIADAEPAVPGWRFPVDNLFE